MKSTKYQPGWDAQRVQRVLDHYESQTDEESVAEDEAAYETHNTALGRRDPSAPRSGYANSVTSVPGEKEHLR